MDSGVSRSLSGWRRASSVRYAEQGTGFRWYEVSGFLHSAASAPGQLENSPPKISAHTKVCGNVEIVVRGQKSVREAANSLCVAEI
jgi:hypothetical protein